MKFVIAMLKIFLLLFMCGYSLLASAQGISLYTFDSTSQQQRFEQITGELRCLVCQNQSLSDSNAPLAKDLRQEVYQMIQQGKNDDAIKSYLVDRYGHFILFKPPINVLTYALWFGPFVLLLVAFLVMIIFIRKRKVAVVELSEDERRYLDQLLQRSDVEFNLKNGKK